MLARFAASNFGTQCTFLSNSAHHFLYTRKLHISYSIISRYNSLIYKKEFCLQNSRAERGRLQHTTFCASALHFLFTRKFHTLHHATNCCNFLVYKKKPIYRFTTPTYRFQKMRKILETHFLFPSIILVLIYDYKMKKMCFFYE